MIQESRRDRRLKVTPAAAEADAVRDGRARAYRNCAPSSASPKIPTTPVYDAKVADAVRKFRKESELKATGVLDASDRQGDQQSEPRTPVDP